jgi:HlyD family secretion protein
VNGEEHLFVIDPCNNKALLRDVRTGLSSGTIFEIIEGLAEGDLVVVEGASRLAEGSLVKVIE